MPQGMNKIEYSLAESKSQNKVFLIWQFQSQNLYIDIQGQAIIA